MAMRIAIAGGGALAKYFAEELPNTGHEVVVLTRATKPFFDGKPGVVAQRITDYSTVGELAAHLEDRDALVSTIVDITSAFPAAHLNIIEACKKSPKCKRFIPSELVRKALRDQTQLEWSIACIGMFFEMFLPKANHYFSYIPDLVDTKTNSITVPGTGDELLSMTSARDVARAVGQLLLAPKGTWRPFVYVEGQKTTQRHLVDLLKGHIGQPDVALARRSLAQLINDIAPPEFSGAWVFAQHGIGMLSGASTLSSEK